MAGDLVPALNAALGAEAVRELRCRDGLSADLAATFAPTGSQRPSRPRFTCNLQGFSGPRRAAGATPLRAIVMYTVQPAPVRTLSAADSGAFSRNRRPIGYRQRQL